MSNSSTSLFGDQTPGLSATRLYYAKVVDNNDPDRHGKIRARPSKIFDGIEDADLPWAIPTFGHTDGASEDSGIICIPKIGSRVLLSFQDGSPFHPIYGGYTVDGQTRLSEADHNYPDRAVVDTRSNELFIRVPGDVHTLIEGNLDFTVMGNSTFRVGGAHEQIVNGSSTERVQGSQTSIVKGDRTELTAGSARKFVSGEDGYYVGGNHTRVAQNIYDNPASGSPAAPAEPAQPAPPIWAGIIRGNLPRALWQILRFW